MKFVTVLKIEAFQIFKIKKKINGEERYEKEYREKIKRNSRKQERRIERKGNFLKRTNIYSRFYYSLRTNNLRSLLSWAGRSLRIYQDL